MPQDGEYIEALNNICSTLTFVQYFDAKQLKED